MTLNNPQILIFTATGMNSEIILKALSKDAISHSNHNWNILKKKTLENKIKFFNNNTSIQHFESYNFLKLNYNDIFSNYIKIILKPTPNNLTKYAKNWNTIGDNDWHKQYWYKILKKHLNKIPKEKLIKLSENEILKELQKQIKILDLYSITDKDIIIDPESLLDPLFVKNLIEKIKGVK